uniref:Uncharacterized protein n=1 Tax=Oryza sativa subsp. japonica TaxID=39947 RepID=Q6K2S9_ORYSJ|nr:hypothetical protein [Oryza sativa Japonica Group]
MAAVRTAAARLLLPRRRWMAGDQAASRRWSRRRAAQIRASMAGSGRGEASERRWRRWRGGRQRGRRGPDGGGGSGEGKATRRTRWWGRRGGCRRIWRLASYWPDPAPSSGEGGHLPVCQREEELRLGMR